jgi:hypothetical protein
MAKKLWLRKRKSSIVLIKTDFRFTFFNTNKNGKLLLFEIIS